MLLIAKEQNVNRCILETIVANRINHIEKNAMGLFAKTSAMLAKIETTSFEEYIQGIHKELLNTYKHYKYPTSEILKKVQKKEPTRKRLSTIWFSYQNSRSR